MEKFYYSGISINWGNFTRYSDGKITKLPPYHFESTAHWVELKDDGSTPFHPLLGAYNPNPSNLTMFKNVLDLNFVPFLKDHKLGEKIIFPCVGYLDMLMTGGYAASSCREGVYTKPPLDSPLCIRDFEIVTPIALNDTGSTEFQIVVEQGIFKNLL